jgi:hypothetical protein
VVVFRAPESWADTAGHDLVKRVVATGGQTVTCCDPTGKVMVDGAALDEPYLGDNAPVDVPAGQVFLLGDTAWSRSTRPATARSRPPQSSPSSTPPRDRTNAPDSNDRRWPILSHRRAGSCVG